MLLLFLGFATSASASNNCLTGQKEIINQFHWMCQANLQSLELDSPVVNGRSIDYKSMQNSLKTVQICVVQQPLFVDDKAVDAVNEPSKRLVTINKDGWQALDFFGRHQLCLHELWGLSFHDHADDDYSYSTQMITRLRLDLLKSSLTLVSCRPQNNPERKGVRLPAPRYR